MRDWFSNFREQHLTTYKLTFRIRYWWFTQLCLLGIIVFGKWHLIPYVLAWWFFGAMAITIYAHRGLSHNSIKIKWKWLEHLFCSLCILSNIGSPLAWAVVHRMHHVYLDDEKDPHSPHQIGFLRSLTHRWDVPFENIPLRFTRGLLRLETPKWYHNNSFFPFIFFTIFIWAVTVAYGTSIYGFAELGYYMMNIFSYDEPLLSFYLFWSGFMTLVPLFLYTLGFKIIGIGPASMILFLTPTSQFLLGISYFGEILTLERFLGFVIIWIAVIIYLNELRKQ